MKSSHVVSHKGVRNVVRREVTVGQYVRGLLHMEQSAGPMPTLIELAGNFAHATARWAKAGFPVRDEASYRSIEAICNRCEFWDKSGYFATGRCSKCGCSGLKRFLKTEKCPIGKW